LYLTALSRDNLWHTSEFSENFPVPLPVGGEEDLAVLERRTIPPTERVKVYDPSGRLIYEGTYGEFRGRKGVFFVLTGAGVFPVLRR
jgi:hypothetical protein